MRRMLHLGMLCTCLAVVAQTPAELDLQNLKQYVGAPQNQPLQTPDPTPKQGAITPKVAEGRDSDKGQGLSKDELQARENAQIEAELKGLKARDKGPRRFASDLFETRQANPAATTEGGIAEDYVLGTGDVLAVNVFGSATFEVPATVDGRGEIVIPKIGSLKVAGLTLGKAKQAVQGLVGRQYSRTTVDVQVLKLREVRVFLMGEVYRGGSYLVPSLSSLVNVLSLAGGPTSTGSFRDIRVVRGGQIIHRLDLYPLRAEGRGNVNFSLQSGDVVFVPVVGTRVVMEGAFLRVAATSREAGESGAGIQLELKGSESAWEAVQFVGGVLPTAYASLLTLQRVDPNGVISVQNIPNSEPALRATRLFFNDVLRALGQTERTEGIVEVAGRIRVPGRFAHQPGLRVKDLLVGQGQLLPDTYLGRGEVVRTFRDERQELLSFDVAKALEGDPAHNLALEPRDRLAFFAITELRLPRKVTVSGPFTRPGTFDWFEGMRASDLVFRAGIPQLSANRLYAELAHTKDGKPSQVLRLDLEKLLSTEAGSPVALKDDAINPKVEPYDTLNFYEKPDYRTHRTVRVRGQVARPGFYVMDQDKPTLSQVIQKAGGLTAEAMPKAGILLRTFDPGTDPTIKGINDIMGRLNETTKLIEKAPGTAESIKGTIFRPPVLHGLAETKLARMVVDFEGP
ncbi:MAG: polysaccharide export protein [Holophagaceae bacterium]|uniref:Polysaccharide export protein n=1 Tax=Candidatus Geothrix skivensis TaxID=2954439 RepID=A0A9D7XMY3_9BACT|nr:polysaccharide export protein [Candidatus Geothrix skivensis]